MVDSRNNMDQSKSLEHFYLDLADEGHWLIKSRNSERYTAGNDKQKVIDLVKRLNEAHKPNVHQREIQEVFLCWNDHEKGQKCNYEQEI